MLIIPVAIMAIAAGAGGVALVRVRRQAKAAEPPSPVPSPVPSPSPSPVLGGPIDGGGPPPSSVAGQGSPLELLGRLNPQAAQAAGGAAQGAALGTAVDRLLGSSQDGVTGAVAGGAGAVIGGAVVVLGAAAALPLLPVALVAYGLAQAYEENKETGGGDGVKQREGRGKVYDRIEQARREGGDAAAAKLKAEIDAANVDAYLATMADRTMIAFSDRARLERALARGFVLGDVNGGEGDLTGKLQWEGWIYDFRAPNPRQPVGQVVRWVTGSQERTEALVAEREQRQEERELGLTPAKKKALKRRGEEPL